MLLPLWLNRYTIGGSAAILVLAGLFIWHRSAVNSAREDGQRSGHADGYNAYEKDIYQPEKRKYEERIQELETMLADLSLQKQQSVERIKYVQVQAKEERRAVEAIPDRDAALTDVRRRIQQYLLSGRPTSGIIAGRTQDPVVSPN